MREEVKGLVYIDDSAWIAETKEAIKKNENNRELFLI